MTILRIMKSDIVREVPNRWASQYSGPNEWPDTVEKTRKLKALPAGFSASDVNKIIGNESWTRNQCTECKEDCDVLVRIGETPDYDAQWVDVCHDCLRKAIVVITAKRQND